MQVCAGKSGGSCLRCGEVPSAKGSRCGQTLLLAPQDADAAATLSAALAGAGFEWGSVGPLVTISGIAGRLPALATLLTDKLSPYTRGSIRAAIASAGGDTLEGALRAFVFAEPLDQLLKKVQHEWARQALAEDWLLSVFHPIVDARTHQVFAQEALIRARELGTGRLIGAGPLIEACGALNLQHQLDQRGRKSAIRAATEHVPAPTKVFINFLPNTIYDPEICLRTTMETAQECQMELSRLVFEVVETEQIPDMKRLCLILDYYRARGVGTAVDDMGAGFASIEYIAALRPDYVKLDRDLMVQAEHDLPTRRKLDLMIATSQAHGARVIAEGIETASQLEMCREAGVDLVQGFYFAKPACPPQAVKGGDGAQRLAA